MTRKRREPGKPASAGEARVRTPKAQKGARAGKPAVLPPDGDAAQSSAGEASAAPVEVVLEPEVLEADGSSDLPAAALDAIPQEETDATALAVPVERDLSRADALQRYMAEVSRHPLLTREEEHELAVRYRDTQDAALAYRLVTANLRLVVKIANEYRRAAFNLLDLIQEGNIGLMQAVRKYDPDRGVKLSSYAAWWIRAYILRHLMDNWRMVKLGTTQAQRKLFFNLRKEQEKLLSQGFDAQPALLAARLDVSEQDVVEMDQRLGNDEFSLDAPIGAGDESRQSHLDRLTESAVPADEQLAQEGMRRMFQEKLAAFGRTLTTDKDRYLFEHRITAEEPLTLQEIGTRYGFTRERARQLEARLLERLREYVRAELPDFAQLSVNAPEDGDGDDDDEPPPEVRAAMRKGRA